MHNLAHIPLSPMARITASIGSLYQSQMFRMYLIAPRTTKTISGYWSASRLLVTTDCLTQGLMTACQASECAAKGSEASVAVTAAAWASLASMVNLLPTAKLKPDKCAQVIRLCSPSRRGNCPKICITLPIQSKALLMKAPKLQTSIAR